MENQETPFKAGLNAGVIVGILSVVITFVVYFISPVGLASGKFQFGMLFLFIGLVIYFGIQYRKSIGGFMDFGPAFNFSFMTMVVAGIISQIGAFLLYNVVDPALPGIIVEQSLENTMEMMEKFGAADSMSTQQIDEMREGLSANYTMMGQIKAFGIALIIYAVLSLILGAIIKKRDKSLDY